MIAPNSCLSLIVFMLLMTQISQAQNEKIALEMGSKLFLITTENTSFPKDSVELQEKLENIKARVSKIDTYKDTYFIELFRYNPVSLRLYIIDQFINPNWTEDFTLRVFNQDSVKYYIDSMDSMLNRANIRLDDEHIWFGPDSLKILKQNMTNIACTYSLIIVIDDLHRIKFYRLRGFENNDFYNFYKDVICQKRVINCFYPILNRKKIKSQLQDISDESDYGLNLIDLLMNRKKVKKGKYNPGYCSLKKGLHQ